MESISVHKPRKRGYGVSCKSRKQLFRSIVFVFFRLSLAPTIAWQLTLTLHITCRLQLDYNILVIH